MEEKTKLSAVLRVVFLEKWHPYFWLGIVISLLYFKTAAFLYTYFDDQILILQNQRFISDLANILDCFRKDVFLKDTNTYYRPMLTVSFMIDAQLAGKEPAVYHITNILLHIVSSFLVFNLFQKLRYNRAAAFFASAIFAVHPALSQAVAWIPGRNDSLLAVFILTAFTYYVAYIEKAKARYIILCLLFFDLALYTKETAVMFLPVVVLYHWLLSDKKVMSRQLGIVTSGGMLLMLVWFFMRHYSGVISSWEFIGSGASVSLREIFPAFLQFLGKALFPFNLSVFPVIRDTTIVFGYLSIALICAVLMITPRERLKRSIFGIGWFILFVFLPLTVPVEAHLEHRLYIPLIGLYMLFLEGDYSKAFIPRPVLTAAGGLIMILFFVISFVHSDIFMSANTFWKSAVKSSPHSSYARNCLGELHISSGEYVLGKQELLEAIKLNPFSERARINLGVIYTREKLFKDARREFRIANKLKPNFDVLFYNYGMLCFEEGKDADAVSSWQAARKLNPKNALACKSLSLYYFITGDQLKTGYYEKQLREKFYYSVILPTSTIVDKRKWLSEYCALGM